MSFMEILFPNTCLYYSVAVCAFKKLFIPSNSHLHNNIFDLLSYFFPLLPAVFLYNPLSHSSFNGKVFCHLSGYILFVSTYIHFIKVSIRPFIL